MPEIRMRVKPFTIPKFVVIEGVDKTIPLSEAPKEVVRELVKEFMSEVYREVGLMPDWRFE